MVVNDLRISQKLINKDYLSMEKDMKCKKKKIIANLLNKVRSNFLAIRVDENEVILGQQRFQFLAIRVVGNAAILAKPDTLKKKKYMYVYM